MTTNAIIMIGMLTVGLGVFAALMYKRMFVLLHLKGDKSRIQNPFERTIRLLKFGFGQKRLVDPEEFVAGMAHVMIFSAFMILALRTLTLFCMAFFGFNFHLPLLGPESWIGVGYNFIKELVLLSALAGSSYFLLLRLVIKPERMSMSGEAVLILFFIQGLMITDIMFEAALVLHPAYHQSFQLGLANPAASLGVLLFQGLQLSQETAWNLGMLGYWLHCTIILVFLNLLPIGKHFHVITGLPTVFFQRLSTGTLPKLEINMDVSDDSEEEQSFGIRKITDLNWKFAMDTYSCTECGRCLTNCPTYVTEKPLTHKGLNHTIRTHLMDVADDILKGKAKEELPDLVPDIVSTDTMWACTTCGWCETACPVFIENVPRLIDMRRDTVMGRGDVPAEAITVFRGMETQKNPWGISSDDRTSWAEGLKIPTVEDNPEFDYLWFVGCASSFDDRQKKVARAFAKILEKADIDYAILGKKEVCNGDSARRLGNEVLFQELAGHNIEQFEKHNVKKVFTSCPHCFNVIKNEYTQFDVEYEVFHHTEMIEQLLRDGRIQPSKEFDQLVTYHDSCYMGRYNDVYDEPRVGLRSIPGLTLKEMPRSERESFCCGAGGGRMWLEEHIGERINQNRVKEAVETGATTIATNCPFCTTMISDGLNELGIEGVETKDLAELIAESLDFGESTSETEAS